jgi:type VI secretion system secreted protein Hcp
MARPIKTVWLFLLGLLGLHGVSAFADSEVICIDGVKGDSTRVAGCIDVFAWSWGASNSGGITPQANVQDFSFTKPIDSSSEDLLGLAITGVPVKGAGGAQFREYKDDCGVGCSPDPYLTITFTNTTASSFSDGNSAGAGLQTQNVTLHFQGFTYCYSPTVNNVLQTAQCTSH